MNVIANIHALEHAEEECPSKSARRVLSKLRDKANEKGEIPETPETKEWLSDFKEILSEQATYYYYY